MLKRIREIMGENGNSPEEIELFLQHYLKRKASKNIQWDEISTPNADLILKHPNLKQPTFGVTQQLLSDLAVCKLNGGLGTSMGCVGPKSAIEVREGKTFLDLIVKQIQSINEEYQTDIPLVLMNSFNTHIDTHKIIQKYETTVSIHTFQQNEFPRLRKDNLLPLSKKKFPYEASYPPGHGDFYCSILNSGVLDNLIAQGKKYLFISNADNLGATLDERILYYLHEKQVPFIMEVTPKTRADIKGGTLVQTNSGLKLLEIAQVPKQHLEEFKSIKKFKIFNTNNIWINIQALKTTLEKGLLDLDVMENHKIVQQVPVIQLETVMGSGLNHFPGSIAVQVPRNRFLPVKKTDDLFLVQSNLFKLEKGCLIRNPDRQFEELPLVRLGEQFQTMEAYQKRVPSIPNILNLDLLTIVGDVYFGKYITLSGNVILVASQGPLHLPRNASVENKVLTGTLTVGEL